MASAPRGARARPRPRFGITSRFRHRRGLRRPSPDTEVVSDGTRSHRHHRRPPAQPQERHRGDPQEEAGDPDRGLGLRQVVARLRHPLRRGAAPLHREPERLRAAVPGPDGQAALRLDPRARPHDLDRAEGGQRQPPLHRGHHHRDPRLPARALGTGGAAHLPQLRPRRLPAVLAADRPRDRGAAAGRSSFCWPRWSRSERASTAT